MPMLRAASSALARSREAMPTISQSSPCCIAGITFVVAILATPSTPQRTFRMASVSAFPKNQNVLPRKRLENFVQPVALRLHFEPGLLHRHLVLRTNRHLGILGAILQE